MQTLGSFTAFQIHDKIYSCGTNAQGSKPEYYTIRHAVLFLGSLPHYFPFPELGIDPNGMISMEWYKNPRCIVTVSINDKGKIFYAAKIGESKKNGSFYYDDIFVIKELSKLIHKVIGEENASNNQDR